jgi:hypothetical protein
VSSDRETSQVWISADEAVEGLAYLEAVARRDQEAVDVFARRDGLERPLPLLVAGTGRRVSTAALLTTVGGDANTTLAEVHALASRVGGTVEGRLVSLVHSAWRGWAADSTHPAADAERIAKSVLESSRVLLPEEPVDAILERLRVTLLADHDDPYDITPITPARPVPAYQLSAGWAPPAAPDPEGLALALDIIRAHLDADPQPAVLDAQQRLLLHPDRPPLGWLVAEAAAWVITHTHHVYGQPTLHDAVSTPDDDSDGLHGRLRTLLAHILREWGATATPYRPRALAGILIAYLTPVDQRGDRATILGLLDDARRAVTA